MPSRLLPMLPFLCLGACSDNQINQIKGSGAEAEILVSPGSIDFGAAGTSTTATEIFTISNVGTAGLSIEEIVLEGSTAFALTLPGGIEQLDAGESAEVVVSWSPRTSQDEAIAWVRSDDPNSPELPVLLQGEVLYADLVIDPNPYDMGYTEVFTTLEGSVDLLNVGGEALTVDNIVVVGEAFALAGIPALPLTIGPGEAVPVALSFSPELEGWFEAELWVSHDGPGGTEKGTIVASTTVTKVTGRICDPSGEGWVVDAHVWTGEDSDGDGEYDWFVETWTDADGYFTLEGVIAGERTIHVQKGSYSTSFDIEVFGGTYELPEDQCLDPGSVDVAVVTGEWDDIGSILRELTIDYDAFGPTSYLDDLLLDPEKLAEYDIIFFNCGMDMGWLSKQEEVAANLRAFAADGGSVYASDWAHAVVEASWPDAIDFLGDDELWNPFTDMAAGQLYPYAGVEGTIEADVQDSTMQAVIGDSTARITMDLGAWVIAEGAGSGTSALLTGTANHYDEDTMAPAGSVGTVPLALRFSAGGTIIYTSFHTSHQSTDDMDLALREIILSL